jgi:acyl carrier protein
MVSSSLIERLRAVFSDVLEVVDIDMSSGLSMGDIEEWDSFAQINLMLAIEAEFSVEFESDEIGELLSIELIVRALEGRLAERPD